MKTIEELYDVYLSCGACVTTDSRTIREGELFIALKGENFDGNEYALRALDAGAAYAVINVDSPVAATADPRLIPVQDTFVTLQSLARHHRRHCISADGAPLKVIGLTGTNGKTTTKELIRAVLASKIQVCATEGNLNNDIGVPLSLLRIRPGTPLAVIEMGANHPDDIKHLVDVCEPDCGLITNVGKGHLLGFGSFEGVQRAKGQLYDYLSEHHGTAFVNVDDPILCSMLSTRVGLTSVAYGPMHDGAQLLPVTADAPYLRFKIGERLINTHLTGAYNLANALAAICVGRFFGIGLEQAAAAIESYIPVNNRSQMQRSERNLLILDAYNANPSSMAAALDNFDSVIAKRKIALLGEMRELGTESLSEHTRLLRRIASSSFQAYLVGDEFRKALDAEGMNPNVLGWFACSDALTEQLMIDKVSGAVVLVKGSRGNQMEKTLSAL